MLARISTWILHSLGWTLQANFPDAKKYVVIAAPHTSNWDFPLGILAARAIRLDVRWIGKHTIFRWPFGWFFRALGGIPVHREKGVNLISRMQELFDGSEQLVLALAPEGTRSKTDHWKTGFWYIARAARVPIVMSYLDFGHKQVGLGEMFYPGDDIRTDFDRIRSFYQDRRGKYPAKESLIQVRNPDCG